MTSTASDLQQQLLSIADRVRASSRALARQSSAAKDDALHHIARALLTHQSVILDANARDVAKAREQGRDDAFIDRLTLTCDRIQQMADDVLAVAALPDPVGKIDRMWTRPNGLQVGKRRIPLGVIGIIYEARPNVTSDAAALCLKSGNGVILKGGSDALESNIAIAKAMREGLAASTLAAEAHDAIGFIPLTDREAVVAMLALEHHIDVVIPRGGKALIQFVNAHARMPVIKHDEGVCHVVVAGSADAELVDAIVINAKTQRPGVCNALEGLIVLQDAASTHLTRLLPKLAGAGVTLHLCPASLTIARELGLNETIARAAEEEDYGREFLALAMAVRVVEDLDAAIAYIDTYSSRHTESLLTGDYMMAQRFLREVNSSVVMVNASTRFSDGGQLGLGAEIGISTTRMHAYGPMGLEELTTTKFIVMGEGQIRT